MTDREKELHFALGHINMACKLALVGENKPEFIYREYLMEIMELIENLYKKGDDNEQP